MLPVFRSLMSGAVFLLACWASACLGSEIPSPKVNRCVAVGKISPASRSVLTEMQVAVEKSLLYSISATSAGVMKCSISDNSGILHLDYKFNDGGWFSVVRDDESEYSMNEARYTSPPKNDAIDILKHDLHDWFGGADCGMDWSKPKVEVAEDDANAKETVYWGEDCNCSARVRRDSGNRVIGLRISSVCN